MLRRDYSFQDIENVHPASNIGVAKKQLIPEHTGATAWVVFTLNDRSGSSSKPHTEDK
jgi:hypothetical protein